MAVRFYSDSNVCLSILSKTKSKILQMKNELVSKDPFKCKTRIIYVWPPSKSGSIEITSVNGKNGASLMTYNTHS